MRFLTLCLLGACVTHDVGTACFVVPTEAGAPLEVTATLGGGDNPPKFSCSVDGTPNALTLTTRAQRRYDPSPFTQNDIFIQQTTTCSSAPLQAGEGSLTFGDRTLTFVVPGDGVTPMCFDPLDDGGGDTDGAGDTDG